MSEDKSSGNMDACSIAPQTVTVSDPGYWAYSTRPNFCSHCGTCLEFAWNFCAGCGKVIAAAQFSEQIRYPAPFWQIPFSAYPAWPPAGPSWTIWGDWGRA
jgi:hypothetical protein